MQLDNKIDNFNLKLTNDIETINSQLTNDIETINSQLDNIATGIYVPISLLNGVHGIENFLRANNSKKIIFPFSREIILDKALVIDFSANIDFNYCIFTVPNNITNWETRYTETDYSIKYAMINFLNTENVSFENLFLNGNGDNVDVDNLIGLTVKGVTNLKADNIHLTNFKYHHLYIAHETKNIVINNLNLKKLGSVFGSSYIYIRNNEDDDIIFNNLSVINDSMDDSGTGQVVYNAGYNVFIYNVKCKNIDCFLDVRKGDCVCDDVIIDECNTVFNIQPYPSALSTVGTLALKNLIAKNLNGLQTTATSVGVYGCEKLILENIELNYKNNVYGSHGIKIYKQNAETPLRNLYFKNIVINNATSNGIAFLNKSMQSNINISVLENITILTNVSESSKNGACGIRVYGNTLGIIDIKNLIEDGYTYDCRDESEIVSLDSKLKNIGTTDERPSFKMGSRSILKGFRYFDTTLNKEIIWSGSNSDGWIIPSN